jgi:hypothetical protein
MLHAIEFAYYLHFNQHYSLREKEPFKKYPARKFNFENFTNLCSLDSMTVAVAGKFIFLFAVGDNFSLSLKTLAVLCTQVWL